MKNKKHKYLLELYPDGDLPFPFSERNFQKFDKRITYGYENYFIHNLYEVLRYYQDEVTKIVDLEFHKITIENKEFTLLECINKMIKDCKIIIHEWDSLNEDYDIIQNTIDDLAKIFSKCFCYLWW